MLLVAFQPQSGEFFEVIFGLLLLFPLSSDPLGKVPSERLALWPLSPRDRALLRIASVWLSPAAWITVALLMIASKPVFAIAFAGAALVFYGLGAAFATVPERLPRWNLSRYIPEFGGPLGGLIQKNLRELLTVLDPYAALVLTIAGIAYRLSGTQVEPDALMMMSILVVLALSTYALCLFGLDTDSSFTRYRLLPLRGWQILAAKDAAFLLTAVLLVLPLAPLAGFAAALMALAVGHKASIEETPPQARWRFTGGASMGAGVVQVFLMFGAGTLVARNSSLVLLPCLAIYAGSLWWFGRRFERQAY